MENKKHEKEGGNRAQFYRDGFFSRGPALISCETTPCSCYLFILQFASISGRRTKIVSVAISHFRAHIIPSREIGDKIAQKIKRLLRPVSASKITALSPQITAQMSPHCFWWMVGGEAAVNNQITQSELWITWRLKCLGGKCGSLMPQDAYGENSWTKNAWETWEQLV